MNQIEMYDKIFALLITVMAGTVIATIFSWKFLEALFDLLIKEFKQGRKLSAFLTVLTVVGMVLMVVVAGAGVWLAYLYIRPHAAASEPTRVAESQATPAQTPTPPLQERGRKSPTRSPRRKGQSTSDETVQTASAPTTPQTSQPPDAAPPEESQTPQTPAAEPGLQLAPTQGQGCPAVLAPTTPIIPPGEKPLEPDQLV